MRIAMIAYSEVESDPRVDRALTALAERGHQVDLFCVGPLETAKRSRTGAVRIFRLHRRRRRSQMSRYVFRWGAFFLWVSALVTREHLRRRYDVVYVHNMPNFLVFAGWLPKASGAHIVLDVHDPGAELLASLRGGTLPSWLALLVRTEEHVSLSFADSVITVNEAMRRRLATLSTKPTPVAVVMNLPNPAMFARVGGPSGGLADRPEQRLVYSGTIAYRNGLDLVVRAIAQLADEFPALRLRLIGDGPDRDDVLALACRLGVAERIEYLGVLPNDEIPEAVAGAVGGVSAGREDVFGSLVFSMKVAEYAALGLPVVCSGTATMRHYFADDELSFFEPGDARDLARAVRDLLTDPQAAQQRAERGLAKLATLDWRNQKDVLVTTVESLERSDGHAER